MAGSGADTHCDSYIAYYNSVFYTNRGKQYCNLIWVDSLTQQTYTTPAVYTTCS